MDEQRERLLFVKHYRTFYLRYAGELIFFARQFVDTYTAEDIVHDFFLKVWDKRSTIIVENDIKNYLYTMVQNACLDYLKHQHVKDTFMDKSLRQLKFDELRYYESSKDQLWGVDQMEAVYASIEKLPLKSRRIFKKAYLDGQKHADIAVEMDISVRTVETHVYKALKFLRKCLSTFFFL